MALLLYCTTSEPGRQRSSSRAQQMLHSKASSRRCGPMEGRSGKACHQSAYGRVEIGGLLQVVEALVEVFEIVFDLL